MKKKSFIFNCIVCSLFAVFVLLNILSENGSYSEMENRYLQGLPKLSLKTIADRQFMDEVEAYSNDQLMFRDFFIKAKAVIERVLGKKENNGVYFAKDGYLLEKPAEASDEMIHKNIESIKTMAAIKRFDVSACIIPPAYEILQDKLPKGVYKPQISAFYNTLYSALEGSRVKLVDPRQILQEHKNDYIYYRSDHHQTAEGSYLVYQALQEACGFTALAKDEFMPEVVSTNFFGTTYSKGLTSCPGDEITAYKTEISSRATVSFYGEDKPESGMFFSEHLEKKDQYSYFLDGNHGLTVISGGVQNGKKLALFKDSYAHSLAPFLINHFESIHLIDMRYFKEDPIQYVTERDITQVLVLYGASTFMTDSSLQSIGEYGKTSRFAQIGLVKENIAVGNGYFADAAFMGDSLTLGFESYSGIEEAAYFCRTSISVGGVFLVEEDGTSLLAKLSASKPKKIYVMLGMNEALKWSNEENIMRKYNSVVDSLKLENPDAVIYIQSMLPISREKEEKSKIDNAFIHHLNENLRKMAEAKHICYVDVYKAVTDSEGYLLDELTSDGVHLGVEGCKRWADYLKTHAVITEEDASSLTPDGGSVFVQGDYDLQAILEQIQSAVQFEGDIGRASAGVLLKTHGIDKEMVVNAWGVVGGGATAEEIALFEAKDEACAKEIKALLEQYVKSRTKSFETYIPQEVPKLKNAVFYADKTFVALVVAKEASGVESLLKSIKK